MESKLVTAEDNRILRSIIHDLTAGCYLTREEYHLILRIIELTVDRMMEAENEQTDRKER